MTQPLITVIVPHHLNRNEDYLKWCVKSILATELCPLEVLVMSDAERGVDCFNDPRVTSMWNSSFNNLTKKWNECLRLASPASKYVMLISDDVMVSKHTIGEMARTIGDNQMILSPASNCDSTTRYHTDFFLGGPGDTIKIPLKCTLDQIKGYEQDVIDYPRGQKVLIDPGWVSFYCTMFPKTVLETVGDFDEQLDVRYNDVDYCQRARNLGIRAFVHLGVFALHFGDRTLPISTSKEEYDAADIAYFKKYRPDIELKA